MSPLVGARVSVSTGLPPMGRGLINSGRGAALRSNSKSNETDKAGSVETTFDYVEGTGANLNQALRDVESQLILMRPAAVAGWVLATSQQPS